VWPSLHAFVLDIWKKLLVAILAAPVLSLATIVYSKSLLVGISSFAPEWYRQYWYLILTAFVLAVLEAYTLYKRRNFFPILVGVTFVLLVVFSLYRLGFAGLQTVPLVAYFFLFCTVLWQMVVVLGFIAWRLMANILI
jgi:hypothetical protein